jgi:hypothetical protein
MSESTIETQLKDANQGRSESTTVNRALITVKK